MDDISLSQSLRSRLRLCDRNSDISRGEVFFFFFVIWLLNLVLCRGCYGAEKFVACSLFPVNLAVVECPEERGEVHYNFKSPF